MHELRGILKYGAFEKQTFRRVSREILSKNQDMFETEGAVRF